MPEYHMGCPPGVTGPDLGGSLTRLLLEGTSWKHQALEAGGARRILNDTFFFSAPQLKREPLGRSHEDPTWTSPSSPRTLLVSSGSCTAPWWPDWRSLVRPSSSCSGCVNRRRLEARRASVLRSLA